MAEGDRLGTGGLGSDSFQSGSQGGSQRLRLPGLGTGGLGQRPALPQAKGLDLWAKQIPKEALAPAPRPVPPPPTTGPLAGAVPGSTAPLPGPPPSAEELRAELATHAEFAGVMAPRMRFLTYVLGLRQRSGPALKLALAKQKPDIAQMAEGLLQAMGKDPQLALKMQEALERVAQAGAMAREAEQRLAKHDELPPQLAAGALAGFDLAAFKRAIFWMSTLDATFAHQPILAQVFPPVARKGSLGQAGGLEAKVKPSLAKRAQEPAAQGDRPTQQAAKSSPLAPRGDPTGLARPSAQPSELGEGASPWLGRAVRRLEHWLAEATAPDAQKSR